MLTLYRRAIALRRELTAALPTTNPATTDPSLTFVESGAEVLHLRRGERWHCVTNFGARPVPLPAGTVLLTSAELVDGLLPTDATAWVSADSTPR